MLLLAWRIHVRNHAQDDARRVSREHRDVVTSKTKSMSCGFLLINPLTFTSGLWVILRAFPARAIRLSSLGVSESIEREISKLSKAGGRGKF